MTKKRWKKKGQAAPSTIQSDGDPTTRSIALFGDLVAVAAGKRWRVVDISAGKVLQDNTDHEGPVRGVAFSPDGQYLVTCADDKMTCVWRLSDWACVHKLKSGKKATACTFSADSKHIFFSDRFGDVLCATPLPSAEADGTAAAAAAGGGSDAPAAVEGSLLLGHLQSIVTSLACCSSSTGQPLIISADKDGKVRASVLPADPVKGSYEIQSYCLGHTKFVTSAAAVPAQQQQQQQQQHMAISGSGDGTVRLWDVDSGKQLGCFVASEQPPPLSFQQQQEQAGGELEQQQQGEQGGGDDGEEGPEGSDNAEEQQEQGAAAAAAAGADDGSKVDAAAEQDPDGADEQQQGPVTGDKKSIASKYGGRYHKVREACCAVLSVAVSPDGRTVAAAVEGQQELQLLSLDAATGQMQLLQKLAFSDVTNPAAVTFDSAGRLWAVGGVLVRQTESAHVGVAAQNGESGQWEVVTASVLPDAVRASLELRVQEEEEQQQQQQSQEGYYFEGMKRAVYVVEEGVQKRQRRDARDIERLRALVAAEDQEKQQKDDADAAEAAKP